jgi:beta-lactamase superfamily II metal-dependent hydrolase
MLALLDMIATYAAPVSSPPEHANLGFTVFHNTYPEFADTNNLSMALFLRSSGFPMLFPGDLERSGLRKLLERGPFRGRLSEVRIFAASHHGRKSGYEPEVFNVCKPDIAIISDEAKHYETQEHSYDRHAQGIT